MRVFLIIILTLCGIVPEIAGMACVVVGGAGLAYNR